MSAQGRFTRLLGAASGVLLVFGVVAVLTVSPARMSLGQATRPAASTGANDVFLLFEPDPSNKLPLPKGESTVVKDAIEVDSFDFGIENQISIGAATTGAGAGKATFHNFTIKKPVDAASPFLFEASATSGHYNIVRLVLRRSGVQGSGKPYLPYLVFTFKLVAVKSIDWSGSGGDRPVEQVVFEYGSLVVTYMKQNPDGSLGPPTSTGWNRVSNVAELPSPLPPF
jgi:type VI secretion system secreted protein Hcp